MNNIKIFAAMLLSSVLFSSAAIGQEIDKVPDCATGHGLLLRDNGWLVSSDLQNVASHHEILADMRQPGVPDALWHDADHKSRQIFVCSMEINASRKVAHYFVR